jgi:hypothetical protein
VAKPVNLKYAILYLKTNHFFYISFTFQYKT